MKTKTYLSLFVILLALTCCKKEDTLPGSQWGTTIQGGYNVLLSFTTETQGNFTVSGPGVSPVTVSFNYTYSSPSLTVQITAPADVAEEFSTPYNLSVHGKVIDITKLVHALFPRPEVLALAEITLTKK